MTDAGAQPPSTVLREAFGDIDIYLFDQLLRARLRPLRASLWLDGAVSGLTLGVTRATKQQRSQNRELGDDTARGRDPEQRGSDGHAANR